MVEKGPPGALVYDALHLQMKMPLNLNLDTTLYTAHHMFIVHLKIYHFTLQTSKVACVGLKIYMVKCTLMYTPLCLIFNIQIVGPKTTGIRIFSLSNSIR